MTTAVVVMVEVAVIVVIVATGVTTGIAGKRKNY
jgi:hypothetical protein